MSGYQEARPGQEFRRQEEIASYNQARQNAAQIPQRAIGLPMPVSPARFGKMSLQDNRKGPMPSMEYVSTPKMPMKPVDVSQGMKPFPHRDMARTGRQVSETISEFTPEQKKLAQPYRPQELKGQQLEARGKIAKENLEMKHKMAMERDMAKYSHQDRLAYLRNVLSNERDVNKANVAAKMLEYEMSERGPEKKFGIRPPGPAPVFLTPKQKTLVQQGMAEWGMSEEEATKKVMASGAR